MEARTLDAARREFDAELERLLAGADGLDTPAGDRPADRPEQDAAEHLDALILAALVSP